MSGCCSCEEIHALEMKFLFMYAMEVAGLLLLLLLSHAWRSRETGIYIREPHQQSENNQGERQSPVTQVLSFPERLGISWYRRARIREPDRRGASVSEQHELHRMGDAAGIRESDVRSSI